MDRLKNSKKGVSVKDASELCVKEWSSKNGLEPDAVTAGSSKKIWWTCSTCEHEWQATPANRIGRGSGCIKCSFKRNGMMARERAIRSVGSFCNALPELLPEWDIDKNGGLNPEDFPPKSSQKVWWKCGNNHSWMTTIASRTDGSNCPHCVLHGTSQIELRLFTELLPFFPDAKLKEKVEGFEVDIYLEEIGVGIEIDGYRWHETDKNKSRDERKSAALSSKLHLLRLRDDRLPPTDNNVVQMNEKERYKPIVNRILLALEPFAPQLASLFAAYRESVNFHNSSEYLKLIQRLPKPLDGKAFAEQFPEFMDDWVPELNNGLSGYDFYSTTKDVFTWRCSKCGATYEMAPLQKYQYGSRCPRPQCYVPPQGKALSDAHPALAVEWDNEMNSPMTAANVFTKSKTKYWWKCRECGTSFQATPEKRVLYPYRWGCANVQCSTRTLENSIASKMPHLVKDWVQTKNNPSTPENTPITSGKPVWWKCNICGAEKQLSPAHRSLVKTTCGNTVCRNTVKRNEGGALKRKKSYSGEQAKEVIALKLDGLSLDKIRERTSVRRSTADRIIKEYLGKS